MPDLDEVAKHLAAIAAVLGALVLVLRYLKEIYEFLKPILSPVLCVASIFIPNAVLIWFFMYRAALNSSRLGETQVFLWLTAQLAIVVSAYSLAWGIWIQPKLCHRLWRQSGARESLPDQVSTKPRQAEIDTSDSDNPT